VAAMTVEDAIYNLETYGRHMGNRFITINHDRHDALLLQNSVIVLEDAGMIERDTVKAWAHCNVRIINRYSEKVDFTT
jgi:ABC-type transporter Mla maintaining outer membrane lipid asymmetry ATPase subunit MlaF